jgi:signal transduction histidine kinase
MNSLPGLKDENIISSVWLPLRVGTAQQGVMAVAYRSYHSFEEREMRLLTSLAEKTAIALANAKMYENLLEREHELKVLSGARVDAQESERRRIAREIHDGLGQILTAIKLNVEIMEDSPGLGAEDQKKIKDVKSLLDSVMKEAREISYNLMPSVLEDFGLSPALQLLSERFGAQTGIHVSYFSKTDIGRLDQQMEVALYRIVQEAMNNSVRHGEASQLTVQLSTTETELRMTIEDNGKGMDEAMPTLRRAQGGGIGLASMRERVNSFNGSLHIDSSVNKGTLVIVELPLVQSTEQEST